MANERIELTDSVMDIMLKMSEGNPGALTALMEIQTKSLIIDPQGSMGGIGSILLLDTWNIYGSSIYILYSDKCGKDIRKLLMLLRATQLGYLSSTKLQEMATDQMREVDLTEDEWINLDTKVCERLVDFQK